MANDLYQEVQKSVFLPIFRYFRHFPNRQPMAVDLQSADDKSVIFNEAKED